MPDERDKARFVKAKPGDTNAVEEAFNEVRMFDIPLGGNVKKSPSAWLNTGKKRSGFSAKVFHGPSFHTTSPYAYAPRGKTLAEAATSRERAGWARRKAESAESTTKRARVKALAALAAVPPGVPDNDEQAAAAEAKEAFETAAAEAAVAVVEEMKQRQGIRAGMARLVKLIDEINKDSRMEAVVVSGQQAGEEGMAKWASTLYHVTPSKQRDIARAEVEVKQDERYAQWAQAELQGEVDAGLRAPRRAADQAEPDADRIIDVESDSDDEDSELDEDDINHGWENRGDDSADSTDTDDSYLP